MARAAALLVLFWALPAPAEEPPAEWGASAESPAAKPAGKGGKLRGKKTRGKKKKTGKKGKAGKRGKAGKKGRTGQESKARKKPAEAAPAAAEAPVESAPARPPARPGPAPASDPWSQLEKEAAPAKSSDPWATLSDKLQPDKKSFARRLREGFQGKLRLREVSFLYDHHETNSDSRHHFTEVGLDLWECLTGKGNIFELRGWFEAATLTDAYSRVANPGQDLYPTRNYAELTELFYTREFPGLDLTVGKRIPAAVGLSTLYRPADRLSVADLNDPSAPKNLGLWGAEASAKLVGGISLRALWLPVFATSKFPHPRSRWTGRSSASGSQDVDFNFVQSQGVTVVDSYPKRFFPDSRGLLRLKTTARGWDIFASGFYGPSPAGVLREANTTLSGAAALQALVNAGGSTFIKEHPTVWHGGAGFSTTIKKLELHGEALYQRANERKDDDYASSVGGFTYTFDELPGPLKLAFETVTVTGEYAAETLLREQNRTGYVQSSRRGRGGKDTYLGRLDFKVNEDFRLGAGFVYDHNDGGQSGGLGFEYRIRSGLKFRSGAEFYEGHTQSAFGRWSKNDRVASQLEYSF